MAKGGAGKGVAGCSCLLMVLMLAVVLFISFGMEFAYQYVPQLSVVWDVLGGTGRFVSYGCCCLSGVGVIIGIVMLLMGGKKAEDSEYV